MIGPHDPRLPSLRHIIRFFPPLQHPSAHGTLIYINDGAADLQLYSEPSRAAKAVGTIPPYAALAVSEHRFTKGEMTRKPPNDHMFPCTNSMLSPTM